MKVTVRPLEEQVRALIVDARARAGRAVNRELVELYWQIGRLIVEDEQGGHARAAYGEAVIVELSRRLTREFGRGFTAANLRNMRQFYLCFPGEENDLGTICYSLRSELSWTHYRLILRVADEEARRWYMHEAADAGWNTRTLARQIGSHSYERLLASRGETALSEEHTSAVGPPAPGVAGTIKDPYVFEFLGLPAGQLLERDLEAALLDDLQQFLLEMGRGFSFVARQRRVVTETADFYIDLVFYHYRLKCFVIVDLKTGALSPRDIGQLDMYVRLFDDAVRGGDDNPTIGLLLCSHKDETVVRYSVLRDSERMFAAEYRLHLPTEEEIRNQILRGRNIALEQAVMAEDE